MLHKNDVLISRSGVLIDNFLLSPDFECKILCLTDSVISDILHNNIENFNKAIYIQNRNVISLSEENIEQFTHYYWLIRNKMNQKETLLRKEVLYSVTRAMLLELSANLAETDTVEPRALSSHSKQIFDSFLNLLSTNDVKRHSVATYASWLSVSPKYLSILCSNYSNRSASEWIDRYVVEDIRYYLCNTDFSIKEVAYKLGFCNLSLFGTYVRRHFHQSPAVLRRHLRTA